MSRSTWTMTVLGSCVLLIFLAGGCGGGKKRTFFIDEQADFSTVETIALLPLANFTSDVNAPEKVSQILTIEMLDARAFNVVALGETRPALAALEIVDPEGLSVEQIRTLGERLGAQALMLGTVREMAVDRSAGVPAPQVSLQFRLVDTATGQTIWSSVVSRSGAGTTARLFGVGGKSINSAIQDMVREALSTLIR